MISCRSISIEGIQHYSEYNIIFIIFKINGFVRIEITLVEIGRIVVIWNHRCLLRNCDVIYGFLFKIRFIFFLKLSFVARLLFTKLLFSSLNFPIILCHIRLQKNLAYFGIFGFFELFRKHFIMGIFFHRIFKHFLRFLHLNSGSSHF